MKTFVAVSLLILSLFSYAGPLPPDDLFGEELKVWLKKNWYSGKHQDLGYDEARRAMFSFIDRDASGMVTGIYSGYKQQSKNTTFLDPINTEHTIPQSWFDKKSPMRSDIHHLFPTHKDVNSARSNLLFDEIDDNSTDKWFVEDNINSGILVFTSVPANEIDSYSELKTNDAFEPREDHKGNLARAVYYFFTMYPDAAGDITSIGEKNVLFQWHLDDPVDATEKERNDRIDEKQGNRNPYIDHPDLVAKAWGDPNPGRNINDIMSKIQTLKTEIAVTEATLKRLRSELTELENMITDN